MMFTNAHGQFHSFHGEHSTTPSLCERQADGEATARPMYGKQCKGIFACIVETPSTAPMFLARLASSFVTLTAGTAS